MSGTELETTNGEEKPKERDVDLESVIVGPPGYGSPDPRTQAGRLVSLDEHPDAENIAADYGSDVTQEQIDLAEPENIQAEKAAAAEAEAENGNYDSMTKAELVALADQRGIDTTGMTKADVVDALTADDANGS
jgi:hypothetical protein